MSPCIKVGAVKGLISLMTTGEAYAKDKAEVEEIQVLAWALKIWTEERRMTTVPVARTFKHKKRREQEKVKTRSKDKKKKSDENQMKNEELLVSGRDSYNQESGGNFNQDFQDSGYGTFDPPSVDPFITLEENSANVINSEDKKQYEPMINPGDYESDEKVQRKNRHPKKPRKTKYNRKICSKAYVDTASDTD